MSINNLRKLHPRLIYQDYQYQVEAPEAIGTNSHSPGYQLRIKYNFLLEPDIKFQPQLIIKNVTQEQLDKLPKKLLDNLIFHLGLAELPSYWKCACPPEIVVRAGSLSRKQIAWWQDLFLRGLGEFYYLNQIEFTQEDFLNIKAEHSAKDVKKQSALSSKHYRHPFLIPVGGGKDSGLTLGIFDRSRLAYHCLVLEPTTPAAALLTQASQCQQVILAKRTIDSTLLQLNQQGYLNGHTPFSAYFAFFSLAVAHLFGYQRILVSNESSADQANLNYQGLAVNHQYSKSFEFEQKFRSYSQQYLASQPGQAEYLSLLRPLNELQIAQVFSSLPQFLPIFKSCNVAQQENAWCHSCAKCLFVFMMLYPFVDYTVLTKKIFQHDLFADKKLLPLALSLVDANLDKPLDCVGTEQEVLAACWLAIQKHQVSSINSVPAKPLPIVLEEIQQSIMSNYQPQQLIKLVQNLQLAWNEHNNLDGELGDLLKKQLPSL